MSKDHANRDHDSKIAEKRQFKKSVHFGLGLSDSELA